MWAEQLPNGKVKFIERYTDPMTLKEHRVSVRLSKNTASTRKQAQATLDDKIAQKIAASAASVQKDRLRLRELVDLYRTSQNNSRRASTCARNYYACNSLMKILGEDILVEKLTAGYVNKKLQDQHESVGTTNERITRLKALIRWGYKNDYIEDIRWLDKLEKEEDKEKKIKLEEKYLEAHELKLLVANLPVQKWAYLSEFTALSGLRIGEALALFDSDVDLKNRTIYVTKNYDTKNNETGYPKTSASNREVYIQDELYILCRRIRASMNQERMLTGIRTNLFFSDVSGNHLNYFSYNKCLKETAKKVLTKNINITTHVMRHTHVALMAEQGIALDVISRRLGHSDSKITRQIYFHVTQKMKERDNQLIKEIHIL